MPAELLVTGCYRSGTTLLEKLLHAQPGACVASQPFAALYSYAKELFDTERGLQRRYPLGHRFLETCYNDADFAEFLDRRRLDVADLQQVFDRLAADRKGLWTPAMLELRGRIEAGSFLEVRRRMLLAAAGLLDRPDARVVGSKEILVEEYVPYLLANGVRVVLIVRDPRDMVASLDFSDRDNATGADRPVLYSVRVWRKSVATALACEGHPLFRVLRYEDLVAMPDETMRELRGFLGLPVGRLERSGGELLDQHGRVWRGNSSFADQSGVSRRSIGCHSERLPAAVREMIEATAGPEMAIMGYVAERRPDSAITSYRDPFEAVHTRFPRDYSEDPRRVGEEIERLRILAQADEIDDAVASRWFIYPAAYRRLRASMAR
ncbi:MAG: sulfotransferase [Steroidobacteraceae bacterium]